MPSNDIDDLKSAGIVGRIFLPEAAGTAPALLVLGGSDGGLGYAESVGKNLAAQGYAVLALAYFNTAPLPPTLAELPLEYFDHAVRWLENHPRVDARRIGVFGFSKGAEAALLLASRNSAVRALVAAAPTHVAWEGLNGCKPAGRASWAVDGAALSHVPYDRTVKFKSPLAMYTQSLAAAHDAGAAGIAVENINGPLLLLSGGRDQLWPSAHMAERIMERLEAHDFRHAHQHIGYPDAGHAVAPVFRRRDRIIFRLMSRVFGGDAGANRRAQLDAWVRTVAFFDRHLASR